MKKIGEINMEDLASCVGCIFYIILGLFGLALLFFSLVQISL
ncbi:hypothetical protein IBB3154_050 (plasmid) [Ligilactobacillus salivarius]|nr:hypothetical protein [Ligilactobacillus salivarius]QIG37385.1 hypothetical protein IBB3154_050 [Ligilactobacillus salivarius]